MDDRELGEKLLRDHFVIAAALVDLQLRHLSDENHLNVVDAHRQGTGHVELRTRVETSQTELVLVPTDGTEPLWLARTGL